MLHIFDTLSRKKKRFVPLEAHSVKMYVCGITVYDFIHLGHGRTFTAFDMIVRYLQYRGYEVTYIRNITDIDDKILNKAAAQKVSCTHLAEQFIHEMHVDFEQLQLLPPTQEPRATETIPEIIELAARLEKEGYAYLASNGDLRFNTERYGAYGQLSGQQLLQLQSGSRPLAAQETDRPHDFVLWKKVDRLDTPHWDSPWGLGRPGWHIECSAMSEKALGLPFDIHGGGSDLRFPHHENELAQSCAGRQHGYAQCWMHTGMVTIKQNKMSKSLGNFVTLRTELKHHHPEVLRYFFLSAHYRSPLVYSRENLAQAKAALLRLYETSTIPQALQSTDALHTPSARDAEISTEQYEQAFIAAMNDDFNTPAAYAVLFQISKQISLLPVDQSVALRMLLKRLGRILGFFYSSTESVASHGDRADTLQYPSSEIEAQIARRKEARQQNNWIAADAIRTELLAKGIILQDHEDGSTTWTRAISHLDPSSML